MIFIDEIDALATTRDSGQATAALRSLLLWRRLLLLCVIAVVVACRCTRRRGARSRYYFVSSRGSSVTNLPCWWARPTGRRRGMGAHLHTPHASRQRDGAWPRLDCPSHLYARPARTTAWHLRMASSRGISARYLRLISQDLDPALLSRFQLRVTFPLPDTHARRDIFRTYARHLPDNALGELSRHSAGASGRDIRDVCEATERRWAARRVRGESVAVGLKLPPVDEYVASLRERGEAQRAHAPPMRGT